MKKLLNDLNNNAQQSSDTKRINDHFCAALIKSAQHICYVKYLYVQSEEKCVNAIKIWEKR